MSPTTQSMPPSKRSSEVSARPVVSRRIRKSAVTTQSPIEWPSPQRSPRQPAASGVRLTESVRTAETWSGPRSACSAPIAPPLPSALRMADVMSQFLLPFSVSESAYGEKGRESV
eukprot:scaffold139403_cov38-Tisochrysis_lutea.AAC.3